MKQKNASWFTQIARWASHASGRPLTFVFAVGLIVVWLVTGPLFQFSDTWQLIINTTTTIITFLMVFLIQHTQNRDQEALQIKLDELLRAVEGAQNTMLDLEDLDEEQLDEIREGYVKLAKKARAELKRGKKGANAPAK